MVACILACLVLLVSCRGAALDVLLRRVVVRVFSGVTVRCAIRQSQGGAIPRGGSSDRSVGCLELRCEWEMQCCCTLHGSLESGSWRNPYASAHVPGTAPGTRNSVEPKASQSTKASSMVLMLFLLSHRHAAPLKSLATKSTFS